MKKTGKYRVPASNRLAEKVAEAFFASERPTDKHLQGDRWLGLDGRWTLYDDVASKHFALIITFNDSIFPDLNRTTIFVRLLRNPATRSGWRPSYVTYADVMYKVTVGEDGSFSFTDPEPCNP